MRGGNFESLCEIIILENQCFIKKKGRTTFPFFPFDLHFHLDLENNSDDIVKESTRQNVGPNLVDYFFEKALYQTRKL